MPARTSEAYNCIRQGVVTALNRMQRTLPEVRRMPNFKYQASFPELFAQGYTADDIKAAVKAPCFLWNNPRLGWHAWNQERPPLPPTPTRQYPNPDFRGHYNNGHPASRMRPNDYVSQRCIGGQPDLLELLSKRAQLLSYQQSNFASVLNSMEPEEVVSGNVLGSSSAFESATRSSSKSDTYAKDDDLKMESKKVSSSGGRKTVPEENGVINLCDSEEDLADSSGSSITAESVTSSAYRNALKTLEKMFVESEQGKEKNVNLQKELESTEARLNVANKKIGNISNELTAASQKINKLRAKRGELKDESKKLAAENGALKKKIARDQVQNKKLEAETGALNELLRNLSNSHHLMSIAITDSLSKDEMIASLKEKLESSEELFASKDERIASLKADLENSKPIIETIDLVNEEAGPPNKRARTEPAAKSGLAIVHKQNQKMAAVKKEKNDELRSVREEKQAAETKLKSAEHEKELAVECKICFVENDENYALVPCGHVLCVDCKDCVVCPTCNGNVESRLRVYN